MKSILPDAVKAKALATFSRTLIDEAIIHTRATINEDGTPSVVVDDFGNPVDDETTWTEAARYKCRIGRESRRPVIDQNGQPKALDTWILTLPLETTIDSTSQVEVNGDRYEITGAVDTGTYSLGRRFYVRRIQA